MAASTSASASSKRKRSSKRQRPEYWDGECPVCLEEADDETELLVAPCGHVFCSPCLSAALRCALGTHRWRVLPFEEPLARRIRRLFAGSSFVTSSSTLTPTRRSVRSWIDHPSWCTRGGRCRAHTACLPRSGYDTWSSSTRPPPATPPSLLRLNMKKSSLT